MVPFGSHCLQEQKKTVEGVGETAAEAMKRDCSIIYHHTHYWGVPPNFPGLISFDMVIGMH